MRMERMLNKTVWGAALVLGQASALWGLAVALGWAIGFALIISAKGDVSAEIPFHLSAQPPLIGLGLAALGLLLAQKSRIDVWYYAVAGLILNAIPLALALVLMAR